MIKTQTLTPQSFGEFFRSKRISLGFTLRTFCNRFGFDPGYISRIETGVLLPPKDKDALFAFAKALGIKETSTDSVTFFDLAYIAKGQVPKDILAKEKAPKFLPLLFRTVRGQRLTKKKLEELVDLINHA